MRIATILAVAFIGATCLADTEHAKAAIQHYQLNIPRQSLDMALKDLAQQTGLQIGRFSERIDGSAMVGPVQGAQTPAEALAILLSNTGLAYKIVSDTTFAVYNPKAVNAIGKLDGKGPSGGDSQRNQMLASTEEAEGNASARNNGGESSSSQDSDNKLEEVVVTAQKRKERLQDVPISISVLGGDMLDNSTRLGSWDALANVPGVAVFSDANNDVASLNVRGVTSAAQFNGSSPVAYYLDGVPFAFVVSALVPDVGIYDLDRIEVLRGPQGTLYGANALNGVVRVLTKGADLNQFDFKARSSVASTTNGAASYRGDAAINVPLIEGKLAVRAVAGYQDMGGWIDAPSKNDINNNRAKNFRLKVNAAPTDKLTIGLSGWWSRTAAGATNSSTPDYLRLTDVAEPQQTGFDAYNAEIDYDLGFAQLTSRSSYLHFDLSSILDFYTFCDPRCPPFKTSMNASVSFVQELNLSSASKGPWRWTLGAMYRDAQDNLRQDFVPFFADNLGYGWTSESTAVFGELTRAFMGGRWELTGGLRYFQDKVGMHENSRSAPGGPDGLISSGRTFDKVTPRAVLTWHPRENSSVYASYGQGYRSGLEQFPYVTRGLASTVLPSTKPDTLTNYELGMKSNLMGGLVDVEAAVFYLDWKDVQQTIGVLITDSNGNTNGVSVLLNGPSASGLGAETTITLRPVRGLAISGNVSWNSLEFDRDPAPGTSSVFLQGDRINDSPEYTAGGAIDYAFPLSAAGARGHVSTSATFRGKYSDKNGPTDYLPAGSRLIARAEAGVDLSRGSGNWDINAYVDNLTNNYAGTAAELGIPFWVARPRPRTYGLQVEYKFK